LRGGIHIGEEIQESWNILEERKSVTKNYPKAGKKDGCLEEF